MTQYIVDAFTHKVFGGNPAAVCLLDAWLPRELMLAITRENNLSETAFAVKTGETWHLRWFTPGGEIDLCGHATLATAFVILTQTQPDRDTVAFDTLSGRLTVHRRGDLLEMDFPAYALEEIPVTDAMTEAYGARPTAAFLGRDLLCVFAEEDTVRAMAPDQEKLKGLEGLLQHATARGRDFDCVSRSFCPKCAIPEDPVCGSGHCHIAPYWAGVLGQDRLEAWQASPRGGALTCTLVGDRVRLAGRAVLFAQSRLFLPERSQKKTIFFDLDGTLTESGPGIMNCARLMLDHYGRPYDEALLRSFIGPPLRVRLEELGYPPEEAAVGVGIFRRQYNLTGKFENAPYPGVLNLLDRLKAEGHRLFVATSKPEVTAREILEHFDMTGYFEEICGADLTMGRDKKDQIIACLKEKAGDSENVIMVGDTDYDVLGARAHGIPTIGVTWGYGDPAAMTAAGAIALADTMEALYAAIQEA